VYHTNQKSVNLFAEALSKKINGLENYFSDKGIDVNGVRLYDGSGVSRFNMLSSSFLCDVLLYAYKQNYKDVFLKSLPRAGQSGTLRSFARGTCLENNLIAKTGSMKAVRAYSGYIRIRGKQKAFTCIVNNYSCKDKEIKSFVEKLLISLCN
jgi:D-alanyl-D-alanine carboxypeptidase/D-alanyl-D-alanine-endopeptidase (penicillin-binding protein 4)